MPDDPAAPVADPAVPAEPAEPAAPAEPKDETVAMPKAEVEALRRRVAESEKTARKHEHDRKKAEEERQAEQGKWKELAETREQELTKARETSARIEREQRITRLASRLKFLDPTDVIGRVSAEDGQDDGLTEAALLRIADSSPHLIAKETQAPPEIGQVLAPSATQAPGTPGGKPAPPPGKAPLQSLDEANSLPQAEVVARMDEVEWLEREEQQRK